jgi:predicted double-glycine peptidase
MIGRGVVACIAMLVVHGIPAVHASQQVSTQVQPPFARGRLLDVPFVPQSEALCGGAAAAMLFRYWRPLPAYAEDFASLVDDSAEGIRLGELARAVRERGWRALPFASTAADVRSHLAEGRPVIALIEDRPGRYHYVVLVAWAGKTVVFHDPARGPFRTIDAEAFDRAWAITNRTALLILPSPVDPEGAHDLDVRIPAETADGTRKLEAAAMPDSVGQCARGIDRAVEIARGGDLEGADTLLGLLDGACPSSSAVPRELAGIRFLQRRWDEAIALAEKAVARDRSDAHAWQLLATSRFLRGDPDGALRAWNARNEPHIDLTRVDGLDRTHHEVVAELVNLPARSLLTARQLERAKRRVAELPSVQMSRVTYSPRANGLATVDVAVVERPFLPRTRANAIAAVVRAAAEREVRLDVASPGGSGELWTGKWRWSPGRPRVSIAAAMPKLWRWTGSWRLSGEWERESYRLPNERMSSERKRAAITYGDWQSGNLRWELTGGIENWTRHGRYVSVGAGFDRRFLEDTLALRVNGAMWPSIGQSRQFGSADISSAWRAGREDSFSLNVVSGVRMVSAGAPLDLWTAADTGHAGAALLRAHPLIEDGAIPGSRLGRTLAHTTLELQRHVADHPLMRIRWAAFVDTARQGRLLITRTHATHVDVGTGLRLTVPGAPGTLRVDVARGLRDGRIAVSAGWQPAWPDAPSARR